MSGNYLRTFGYVLRRTNYGEADRILNILTPNGKVSAIAKGVRKEKSKLAGGIEMFSLIDFNIHFGRGEMGIVTSAKMIRHYGEIIKDYPKMELAAGFLRKISKASEVSDSEEYFNILGQSLSALNSRFDDSLIEAWFLLNLSRVSGEEINLYRDADDKKLEARTCYVWDYQSNCFLKKDNGEFSENEIKLLRLMITSDFNIIQRIKVDDEVRARVLSLARRLDRM